MIIALVSLLPLIALALLRWRCKVRMPFYAPFLPCLGVLVIGNVLAAGAQWKLTADTEYWGDYASSATYYEDWDERVSCRHAKYRTESYSCGDGQQPRTCTRQVLDGYEHAYDVDYHPAYWQLETNGDQDVSVGSGSFEQLASRWHSREHVALHRDVHTPSQYRGDKFVAVWDNRDETMEPMTFEHTYQNRVQAAGSVFTMPTPPPHQVSEYGLHQYPAMQGYSLPSVLGGVASDQAKAERALSCMNATMGATHQIRMWVIVLAGQPLEAGMAQQALWGNGNKNEFVVAVGTDKAGRVTWCCPFSWQDDKALEVGMRNSVMEQRGKSLRLLPICDYLKKEVPRHWKRKQFKDFDYLSVPSPPWVNMASLVLAMVLAPLTLLGIKKFDL